MPVFSTPAFIDDLTDSAKETWSKKVHKWFRDAERDLPQGHRFFNIADTDATGAVPDLIPWDGFPRKLKQLFPTDLDLRWSTAERVVSADLFGRQHRFYFIEGGQRRNAQLPFRDQDEYCEWHVYRNPINGEIDRIAFTAENPEYWYHLAENDRDKLLALYKDLVSEDVQLSDLFFDIDIFLPTFDESGSVIWENQNGKYNPLNRWNTTDGIVHLTHPANSLAAEVFLARDATILRSDDGGNPVTDQTALICCAGYGGVNRSSDPTIGGRINALVRSGLAVSIADPVGLYIGEIDSLPVEPPNGLTFDDCWKVSRGDQTKKMMLHATFSLPDGSGSSMGDVLVGGEPLRFGGQLAELITVVIHGIGLPRSGNAPTANCQVKCCQIPQVPALLELKKLGTDCPELAPIAASEPDRPLIMAASSDRGAAVVNEDDIPDYRRR